MCLVVFALHRHPGYPLIFAGNRDEFHERPTEAMHWWASPRVLAGRDRTAGGTWLGVTREGRFATVTNYRDPDEQRPDAVSRGQLVLDALAAEDMRRLGDTLEAAGHRYNGFNLIWGDPTGLYYYSNQDGRAQAVSPGVHGLSNGLLNTPWPKVLRVRQGLDRLLSAEAPVTSDALLGMLADPRPAEEASLPDTGVPREWERLLSSPFIVSPAYGTRASTVVLMAADGTISVRERTFDTDGRPLGDQTYEWQARASNRHRSWITGH